MFGIFAALAEYERALISERTMAGLASARARGRMGGAPYKMTPAKIRLAQASMGQPDTNVAALCEELGITRQTLYRHVSPTGQVSGASSCQELGRVTAHKTPGVVPGGAILNGAPIGCADPPRPRSSPRSAGSWGSRRAAGTD